MFTKLKRAVNAWATKRCMKYFSRLHRKQTCGRLRRMWFVMWSKVEWWTRTKPELRSWAYLAKRSRKSWEQENPF